MTERRRLRIAVLAWLSLAACQTRAASGLADAADAGLDRVEEAAAPVDGTLRDKGSEAPTEATVDAPFVAEAREAAPPDASGTETAAEPLPDVLTEPAPETDESPDSPPEAVDAITDLPPETFPTPTPVGCVTAVAAGHHVFECQGLDFDVEVPAQCLASPCGVVLDVHGLTMNAQQQDNNTGLRELGKEHGYIVIQPNAKDPPPLSKWTTYEDDDKVMAFTRDAFAAWHTDPMRFHVSGFSQGGFMTWRLLCKYSDLIASVAAAGSCAAYGLDIPYLGSLSEVGCSFTGTDRPANEVPVLQMHGTLDVIIPYYCGTNLKNAVIEAWSLTQTETVSSDGDHSWKRYKSPSGNVYEFISHDYRSKSVVLQGHCIPGSKDLDGGEPGQLLGGFGCKDASPFAWGEAVMAFFVAHPKVGP